MSKSQLVANVEPILDRLPPEEKMQVVQLIARSHSGPIPSPDDLKQYERVLPGSAERMLGMAERQSAHRQQMEKLFAQSETRAVPTAQYLTFAMLLVLTVAGSYLAISGHDNVAIAVFGGAFVVAGGALVAKFRSEKPEAADETPEKVQPRTPKPKRTRK